MRMIFISFLLVFSILFSAFSCYSVSDEEMYVQAETKPSEAAFETTEHIPKTLQELYKQDCLDSISDSILLDYIDKSLLDRIIDDNKYFIVRTEILFEYADSPENQFSSILKFAIII